MRERLLIHLGSDEHQPIDWLCWTDDEQQVVASGVLKNAEELVQLQPLAQTRQVIVLLPGSEIALQQLALNRAQYNKVQNSLGFLFEEQLAADPQTLHICSVDYSDGLLTVAVVDKSLMQRWQQWLTDAELETTQWIPDFLLLPNPQPEQLVLLHCRGGYLLRGGKMGGGWLDESWLSDGLDLFDPERQYRVLGDVSSEVAGGREVDELNVELPLMVLAEQVKFCPVNMLQGDYRVRQSGRFKQARYLIGAAIFCLSVTAANYFAQAWQVNHQLDQTQQQLAKIYQQTFHQNVPNEPYLVRRAFYQLGAKNNQQTRGDLLTMLRSLTPVFKQFPTMQYQSLSYEQSSGKLVFQVSAPDFATFEAFRKAVKSFAVQTGALSRHDHQVVGTLTIKERS
ncbi:type II secretion system protein GspL [Celerinatantimonas diazotrophica]|uniref:Type II secretion system protein L n=1 Tax=Celerinatantimonas diazotrophica TaxID=412034 RepID=A0A4R1KDQ2_9GAMM|nr:type II secretion system protein GspL [Celerinatantimonas diazotrophica]TCK62746.1 type II secretion system protein L (GspL) [Celerinatantimonas diazotrophica]CAG9298376.1 Type II secretion system protein L [Celerinatantimonas diazotrophica]